MFFWVAFIGRGYCYYCPLGTVLGIIGKAAGQKITTDNAKCAQCSKCNSACPTKTLSYSTKYLDRKQRKQGTTKDVSI
ncbi:MAG: hypothetical protein E7211_05755 [Clostridium lundense]|nr:hypothetical protein [Clostridium lundense]